MRFAAVREWLQTCDQVTAKAVTNVALDLGYANPSRQSRESNGERTVGTSDTVFASTREPPAGASHVFRSPTGDSMNLVCIRNGSLARERVRDSFGLDWTGFSPALESTPAGNQGALMLPRFEPEITPHVPVAGAKRFELDELDTGANVRAVVEAQMIDRAGSSKLWPSHPCR